MLRVPRAHHKYVDTYGAFDFIEKCNEIIEFNDTKRLKKDALEARAVERQRMAVDRVTKQARGSSVPVEIPQPQFHKIRNRERRKQLEELYSNVNVRRPGERNRRVNIDHNTIDLYQPESVVVE